MTAGPGASLPRALSVVEEGVRQFGVGVLVGRLPPGEFHVRILLFVV